ncbi:MAG TPA: cyanophycin synthetase, partial [Burkholderiaceae bacterium]|nr:cyanophycin synthetase [Burkholderiaceae bacterium]
FNALFEAWESRQAVKGRSALRRIARNGQDLTLIDDSYNANPDSVRAGIEVLADLPGESWLVLGDMGEVGDQGPEFHREVGAYAARRGLAALWCAGPAAAHAAAAYEASGGASTRAFATVDELIAALDAAPEVKNVLVKGSRFMRMERVVAALAGTQDQGGAHAA